jgi:hypothetical protein
VVCYIIPLVTAILSSVVWRFKGDSSPAGFWLVLLLCGGALFGVVDHLWNGELFLIGENIKSDLLLGCTITGTIFGSWGVILGIAKINPDLGYRMGILRQTKR